MAPSNVTQAFGLSPRLRGTVLGCRRLHAVGRVIPAPAGNGIALPIIGVALTGYPRACGERQILLRALSLAIGLSPRLRGTDGEMTMKLIFMRVIPAPAGNGTMRRLSASVRPGYPRACGERIVTLSILPGRDGLSPRLRGTASNRTRQKTPLRVIPAPAGNGLVISPLEPISTGYPRACGERGGTEHEKAQYNGLSPRLRGTVDFVPISPSNYRVIPAPAGNGKIQGGSNNS